MSVYVSRIQVVLPNIVTYVDTLTVDFSVPCKSMEVFQENQGERLVRGRG